LPIPPAEVHCPAAGILPDAPFIGLILQKSHIATKDDGHYVARQRGLSRGRRCPKRKMLIM
jgi:hypothetical protein